MTSSLDVSVQAEIMNKLLELKEEKGFSVLFITHDLVLAGSMCDRIVVMNQGESKKALLTIYLIILKTNIHKILLIRYLCDCIKAKQITK